MFNKKSPDFRPDKLAELRAKLSSNKLALLEKIKGLEGDPETRPQDIPPRTASGPVPLSFAQQRLWFLDQLVPNSPAYNVVMAFHLSGELKAELLERSINEVIRRHEVLRTTFPSVEGQPCQAIAPSLVLTLPVVDLRNYSEPDRQEQYRKLADEEARYLFDLAQGPLLRATLFRMHDQKSILLLNVQHIVMDGWSMMIFLNELGVLYQAFVLGKASPLPELPIQYADFAIWQRQWLQGELLRSQVDYWKEKLGTEKSDLELPLDYSRPPIQTFHGGSLKFQLPRSLSRAIKGLCEQASATLFMLLITALKVLLQRYTGQNDVIVGTPIANRNRMEIEGLIGFFVNTLVLKTDLSGNPSFEELLERVREVASSAYGHQDLPFEALVDQLQPERNMSQNPLFQVCFVLQNFPRPKNWDFSGLNFERFESISNGTAKFDLWIQVVDIDDTFYIDVEYDSDLFKESTMIRFLDSYQVLLQGIVSNPQQRISELPILTAGERQKLLVEWNDTATAYPQQNSCLHQIIESQVIRTPNAPAVVFNNEQLTYQELDRRANQLANYLNRKGVGPDTLVGICMECSLEMVIGLLGILKAGAAYVPLDPIYPQERLAFMVTDAQPCLLLTQQKLLSSLAEHQAEVLCLDSGWETIGKESGESRGSGVTGDNLAYLIYTSGSTGKPKGAMNTHRGIVNRLLWMQEKYQLDESDRVLQKTPFSFDVSVWEFFWPLMTGSCLVVARPEGHKDAAYLTRLIQEEKITTMHFVPSMLYAFLEEREIEGCVTLKRVICSGEALPYALQERFFERLPAELHNLYGPTEAAVDVTSWACRKESPEKFVPIGRPIANTQIYLLDQYLNPVPIGVPGELHIGGVQLARGYWNRLQLTAEKFIPDPFSPKEGARLYKTGDLARYLPDGNIEFLGRIDFQVKIRGFRVELGEVETILEEHPAVQKAVVLTHESDRTAGHKQLVAYVVPDPQAPEPARAADQALSSLQVSEWQKVFDKTYQTVDQRLEPDFNVSGWDSSYTGLALAGEEMHEWVDATVDRILQLKPRKVLEIGCGTGLLLSRVAPHCDLYWATDFSATALEYITQQLLNRRPELAQVKLLKREAADFTGLPGREFDVIVINSVVQYFPDGHYLLNVLSKAVDLIAATGSIFVGDVRNLSLLEAFHTDVELEKSPPDLSVKQLQSRIQKRLSQEQELAIDPQFFRALQQELPRISQVDLQLKRGAQDNELARYRYDATLHIGTRVQPAENACWIDWQPEGRSWDKIRAALINGQWDAVGITDIPNLRLESINRQLSLLSGGNCPETVAGLKLACRQDDQKTGVDPELFWGLGAELQYAVAITWMVGRPDGRYQAIFRRCPRSGEHGLSVVIDEGSRQQNCDRQLDHYINNPLQERINRQLVLELRGYLQNKLPNYMIPSIFMVLRAMPVNSNGKFDRRALPAPSMEVPDLAGSWDLPATPTEQVLAEVWAEVLGLEQVGVNNNFFELGGDSIHSIRVVARARQRGIDLSPQQIFQYQTISQLAACLDSSPEMLGRQMEQTVSFPDRTGQKIQELLLRDDVEDVYPVTPFQEYMLRQCLSSGDPSLFHVQIINVMAGNFNLTIFEKVFQAVIDRQATLRTSVIWEGLDRPLQIVHTNVQAALQYQDWRSRPTPEQEILLEDYLRADRRLGLEPDVVKGLRLFVGQMGDAFLIVTSWDYLCLDGWSFNVLWEEIKAISNAFAQGHPFNQERGLSFKNFATWINRQELAKTAAYWREALQGFTAATPLVDRAALENQLTEGGFARQFVPLSRAASDQLRSLGREQQLTPSTLVQGIWSLVLSNYTGSADPVFGVLVNGRPTSLPGIENVVGSTLNVLPFRVKIVREESVLTWLKGLMAQMVELSQHQNTPLNKINDWIGVAKDQALFQSMLVFQNVTSPELLAAGSNNFFVTKMGFPLRIDVYPHQEMSLHMSYYRQILSDNVARQLMKDFQQMIEGLTAVNLEQQRLDDLFHLLDRPRPDLASPRIFYEGGFRIADIRG